MASPQVENGYTKIANELLDALCRTRIPGEARQVFDFILRKNYGYGKKSDMISLSQFAEATGLKKPTVCRGIRILERINLVTVIKKDNKKPATYCINKDFDKWSPLSKKITLSKKISFVIKKDNPSLSKKIPTKENTTKEKRKIRRNFVDDDPQFQISKYLFENIRKRIPKSKTPNFQSWAQEVDRMFRIEKRDPNEIRGIIDWIFTATDKDAQFWSMNILSPKKLRQHYDRLTALKMKARPKRNYDFTGTVFDEEA